MDLDPVLQLAGAIQCVCQSVCACVHNNVRKKCSKIAFRGEPTQVKANAVEVSLRLTFNFSNYRRCNEACRSKQHREVNHLGGPIVRVISYMCSSHWRVVYICIYMGAYTTTSAFDVWLHYIICTCMLNFSLGMRLAVCLERLHLPSLVYMIVHIHVHGL